jgi:DNA polymerase III delta prime subunit
MTLKNLSKINWPEKYRPKTLDDLCISKEIREIITGFGSSIPNLLFCGIQGTGKTTLAKILVQDILKCDYLYINASDESGIDTIRTKVTGFAQTKSLDGNIKVVVLDEADFLSKPSQAALRNLMESYPETTKFILTGNFKHKILDALTSRCQSLDISPDLKGSVLRCFKILKQEGINTDSDDKRKVIELVKKYYPDLRKPINELEKYCVNGVLKIPDSLDNSELISIIWDNLMSKNSIKTRKYLIEKTDTFQSDWDQILIDLLNYIYDREFVDEVVQKTMIMTIADHLEKSSRVIDKEINTFACLLKLESDLIND